MTEPVVAADGVSHFHGTGALRAQILFDVSARVHAGEVVLLTGPSGSGKTTLLTLVGALRPVQVGRLVVLGRDLCGLSEAGGVALRREVGWIFQRHHLLRALTVLDNVLLGFVAARGSDRRAAEHRARALLEQVGLAGTEGRHPDELSIGQCQRVAVARALAPRPRLVLADEPTAALDRQAGRRVVDALRALAKAAGTAVLMVTHDDRVFDVGDRILRMEEGRLIDEPHGLTGRASA
jgi:putative ABC transport system ATP-binding protein